MEHIIDASIGDIIIIKLRVDQISNPQTLKVSYEKADDNKEVVQICNNVCNALSISMDTLTSSSRKIELVAARNYIAYELKRRFDYSHVEIGRIINRDRTSVLHSINTIKDDIAQNNKKVMIVINKIEDYAKNKA